jgi:NTP pyrophosphatase (non-canonical NTP hydrolase)
MSNTLIYVQEEAERGLRLYGPYTSCHEGISVIQEEFEELWDLVKANKGALPHDSHMRERMREEAIQLAATAVKFADILCRDTEAERRAKESDAWAAPTRNQ